MFDKKIIAALDTIVDPGLLLLELHKRFGNRLGIATSGQPTDTAIMALAVKAGIPQPRVYTTDTLRLFPETYAYFETLEKFFGFQIERFTPPEKELSAMIQRHGEFLFFDSKDKQEYCCRVRKVLPNQQALDSLDVWVTGLRRDQSASRSELPRMEIIQHASPVAATPSPQGGGAFRAPSQATRPILKVNALVEWTEKQVTDYLRANGVPNHPLVDKKLAGGWHYESLGCILCTTPVSPNEPRRAGRWRWFNDQGDKKECGLHLPGNE